MKRAEREVTGTVKWFDQQRGFGFVTGPDGDVFVHVTRVAPDPVTAKRELFSGDVVDFDCYENGSRGHKASRVAVVMRMPRNQLAHHVRD